MECKHNYHGQMDDVASSDDNSYSVSPGANENKLRPRPRKSLASFASYIGAHHRTVSHSSRPEWPSIDWSNMDILNDKDGVYKPDTELMCTTITQKLLANPSADLPAQYNTFLLHLIEVYHQSKAEVQSLQRKLAEKNECSQSNVGKMHEEIWPRSLQKADMLQGLENVNSITLHSTGHLKKATATRSLEHNFTVQTPKSSVEYVKGGQRHKQAYKLRGNSARSCTAALCCSLAVSERHQLMSSAHSYRRLSAAATDVESSRDHWPASPCQHGMKLRDCDASSAESEAEGHRVLMSTYDNFSGLEDVIASRLGGWLALRLKCQPGGIEYELSELLRSTRKELQAELKPSSVTISQRETPTASEKIVLSGNIQIPRGRSDKPIETNSSLSVQAIRALGHCRGFSFSPGDDSADARCFSKTRRG